MKCPCPLPYWGIPWPAARSYAPEVLMFIKATYADNHTTRFMHGRPQSIGHGERLLDGQIFLDRTTVINDKDYGYTCMLPLSADDACWLLQLEPEEARAAVDYLNNLPTTKVIGATYSAVENIE